MDEGITNALEKHFKIHEDIVTCNKTDREKLLTKIMKMVDSIDISPNSKPSLIEAQISIINSANTILKSKEELSNKHIKLLLQNKNIEQNGETLEQVAAALKMIKLNDIKTNTNRVPQTNIDENILSQEKDLKDQIIEGELEIIKPK